MKKAKKKTISTVVLMIVFAVCILLFYYYWSTRTEPLGGTKKVSEEQALIDKDLTLYYPETPKEVVKLFAGMMKALYGDPSEDETKALAAKIRELYDQEFLDSNPEDTYITNLYSDLAKWKKENKKITNFILVNEDDNQDSEIDGVKYATRYVSFTIQKNGKFSETWKILLRRNDYKQWKILGWELAPEEDSED